MQVIQQLNQPRNQLQQRNIYNVNFYFLFLDSAAESAADGAADTAAESAEESAATADEAASIAEKVMHAIDKIEKMVAEFVEMDATIRVAKAVIHLLFPKGDSKKEKKLDLYLKVLSEMIAQMKAINTWLEKHQKSYVKLKGIDVPVDTGILAKMTAPLASVSLLVFVFFFVSNFNINVFVLLELVSNDSRYIYFLTIETINTQLQSLHIIFNITI